MMFRGLTRSIASLAALAVALLACAQALGATTTSPKPPLPVTTLSGPTGPGGTTAPATKPKPKAKPAVRAHGKVYLFDSFYVSRNPVTVAGRVIHADGVVYPYVPGQWVGVRISLGHRLIK